LEVPYRLSKWFGLASMLGTYLVLVLIAWQSGEFATVVDELVLFLTGRVLEITTGDLSFVTMFSVIVSVIVIDLACSAITELIHKKVHGAAESHFSRDFLGSMQHDSHFYYFFIAVFAEELISRWLFLGLLRKPFMQSALAFYLLFLIGNSLFAAIHLPNFAKEKERKLLRILPQFMGGIFFSYVYVKYGLFAAVLTHFGSNAVLLACHKIYKFTKTDALLTGYSAFCAITSYAYMEKPLSDVLLWFANEPTFELPGWKLLDYLKVSIMISSGLTALFGVLLYDRSVAKEKDEPGKDQSTPGIGYYVFGLPLFFAVAMGLFSVMGLLVESVPYRVLAISVLFCFLHTSESGSAVARIFWKSMPDMYITMCILLALGFWQMLVLVALETIIGLPSALILRSERASRNLDPNYRRIRGRPHRRMLRNLEAETS
jgi:hypothetical protein